MIRFKPLGFAGEFAPLDLAALNIHDLQRLAPGCMLYAMYAERVKQARATPTTADWQPVTVFDEK